jgi:hypothetical protein
MKRQKRLSNGVKIILLEALCCFGYQLHFACWKQPERLLTYFLSGSRPQPFNSIFMKHLDKP